MPTSVEAVFFFVALIVPGFLLIGGYNRTRAHTLPPHDFYLLAQAVVASLLWLPVAWLLGGHCIADWTEAHTLGEHDSFVVAAIFVNLTAAFATGSIGGAVVDQIGNNLESPVARALSWTGIFTPPTAWDALWERALGGEWAAVEITLKSGERFYVLFDNGSEVGLSPGPRYLFFDTEYDWDENDELEVKENDGIYIDASEVSSVRLEHVQRPEKP
ncbi:MAG TPA: DUF6338 family protein [Solirubrobacterales bacterium]|nr:DUF6338 family protein [Solirubrobacterales bacterium]